MTFHRSIFLSLGPGFVLGLTLLGAGCSAPADTGDAAVRPPASRPAGRPLPPRPAPGLPMPSDDRCVRACVASRQMEARAIEAIETDCRRECERRARDAGH